jgi:hypothetical protein
MHGNLALGINREELDRLVHAQYEQLKAEQELYTRAVSENLENFINQLENLRHDVFRL